MSGRISATRSGLIRAAAKDGAQFIATPENTTLMAPDGGAKLAHSYDEAHDPALPVFRALAKELGVWLLAGSLAIKVNETKTANRSFLFSPDGKISARYSKIHLFDVDLPSGEKYRESNTVEGGDEAMVAQTAMGQDLGLSICYDIRFPQLYRRDGAKRRLRLYRAIGVHRDHRQGALACAASGAGDREWRLHDRAGARRAACQWPAHLWAQPDRQSLG